MRIGNNKMISNYKIIELIGKGACAKVYKAIHQETKQIVAIKEFIQQIIGKQKNLQQLVKRQAQLLQKFNHPNILKCYQYFEINQTWYMVTQFCENGDLQNFIRQNKNMGEYFASAIIRKLVNALAHMHQMSIVHRDFKLANILITGDNQIKVADFGFSKNYSSQNLLISKIGSPIYMAAQILLDPDSNPYTQKCDSYSLGIITYKLVFGRYPYVPNEQQKGIQGLKRDIIRKGKNIFKNVNKNISQQCKQFILLCLEIDPDKRLSAKQLLQHPWINQIKMCSHIRKEKMESVSKNKLQVVEKLYYVIFNKINQHVEQLIKKSLMTSQLIPKIIKIFRQYFPQEHQIYLNVILLILKKNQCLQKTVLQIIIQNRQFSIKYSQINLSKNHINNLKKLLKQKSQKIKQNVKVTQAYILQILKFIVQEQKNQQNPTKQIIQMLKNLNQMILSSYYKSKIQINYQSNQQKQQLKNYVNQKLRKEQLISSINNQTIFEYQSQDINKQWAVKNQYLIKKYVKQNNEIIKQKQLLKSNQTNDSICQIVDQSQKQLERQQSNIMLYANILKRTLNCRYNPERQKILKQAEKNSK